MNALPQGVETKAASREFGNRGTANLLGTLADWRLILTTASVVLAKSGISTAYLAKSIAGGNE